jgi:signal transduction histidine kinase
MKTAFILFFVLLGILQLGVLLSAWPAYRSKLKPVSIKYWAIALSISAISYFCFAVTLATSEELLSKSSPILTVANTLVMASVLFQGLFSRALRVEITSKLILFFIVFIAVFAIHFEITRGHFSFEQRTIFVGLIFFGLYLWQLYEITQTKKLNQSLQLKILFSLVLSEAFFIILRVIVIHMAGANVETVSQIPPIVSLLLWLQLVFNILAYISMVGYWYEEITKSNVVFEYENTKIKGLLEEKEQLLNNLVRSKKLAELGALSASIAHEINQPLSALKINTWLIKKNVANGGNLNNQQKLIESIDKDTSRVADIVETLRAVFRNEAYKTTRINLSDWLSQLMSLVEPDLKEKDISIAVDAPSNIFLEINESELMLVLLNLINNSSRALLSTKAKHKKISIVVIERDNQVELSLADNGPGVPKMMINQLFEMAKDTSANALGLGLWLSRYIVERAGGTISYQPNKVKGSLFILKFRSFS